MKSNLFLVLTIVAVGLAWFFLDPQLNSKKQNAYQSEPNSSAYKPRESSVLNEGQPDEHTNAINEQTGPAIHTDLEREYQDYSDNDEYPTLASRMQGIAARRGENRFTPNEVIQAMQLSHAWEHLDGVPEAFQAEEDMAAVGRKFIRFSAQKIETLMPGDKMEIPIPDLNADYEMKVVSVETHPGGAVTWTGRLVGYPNSNVVHITQSENITVGGIETPNGNFQLHAKEGVGWIASSASMYQQSYGSSDAVVPPKP